MLSSRFHLNLLKLVSSRVLCRHVSSASPCDQNVMTYPLGKTAIVTGAAHGIGLQFVKSLIDNGVTNVVLSDISVKKTEEAMNKLRNKNKQANLMFVKCDVSKCDDMKNLYEKALDTFGYVDIFINNAGIFNELLWSMMVDINLKSIITGTQLAMQHMSRDSGGRGGVVVNMSAVTGLAPLAAAPVRSALESAVLGLTRSMGQRFHVEASGVRVMAMCPGVTDTPALHALHWELARGNTPALKEMAREMKMFTTQDVCHVGECLIQMLREGDGGSVWIVEDRDIYEIEFPHRTALRNRTDIINAYCQGCGNAM